MHARNVHISERGGFSFLLVDAQTKHRTPNLFRGYIACVFALDTMATARNRLQCVVRRHVFDFGRNIPQTRSDPPYLSPGTLCLPTKKLGSIFERACFAAVAAVVAVCCTTSHSVADSAESPRPDDTPVSNEHTGKFKIFSEKAREKIGEVWIW